jgi:hypothetical protein
LFFLKIRRCWFHNAREWLVPPGADPRAPLPISDALIAFGITAGSVRQIEGQALRKLQLPTQRLPTGEVGSTRAAGGEAAANDTVVTALDLSTDQALFVQATAIG